MRHRPSNDDTRLRREAMKALGRAVVDRVAEEPVRESRVRGDLVDRNKRDAGPEVTER